MIRCPKCGSTQTKVDKERKAKAVFVIVDPRVCQECGVAFDPPIPKWAPYGLLLAGIGVLLLALVFLVLLVSALLGQGEGVIRVGQGLVAIGVLGLLGGVALMKSIAMLSGKDTSNEVVKTTWVSEDKQEGS